MNDTWHVALHKIRESHGSVIYQKTLLQKQQIKACFLSPRRVYNELQYWENWLCFYFDSYKFSRKTDNFQLPWIFLDFSSNWPFHSVIVSCSPVYLLALASFLYFHTHCRRLCFSLRILFFTLIASLSFYNVGHTVSSTNGAGKTGQPHVKKWK